MCNITSYRLTKEIGPDAGYKAGQRSSGARLARTSCVSLPTAPGNPKSRTVAVVSHPKRS